MLQQVGFPENNCLKKLIINDNQKIDRLCRNNITTWSCACNHNNCCELILYSRLNSSGIFESGIICAPGPDYGIWKNFPLELLRIFSFDKRTCYSVSYRCYASLIEGQVFRIKNLD